MSIKKLFSGIIYFACVMGFAIVMVACPQPKPADDTGSAEMHDDASMDKMDSAEGMEKTESMEESEAAE